MYAVTSKGVGKPPGYRLVSSADDLLPGEFFLDVDSIAEDQVIAEDEVSLRTITAQDISANRAAKLDRLLDNVFDNPDAEDALLAKIIKELGKDIADLRGITPAAYKAELKTRII